MRIQTAVCVPGPKVDVAGRTPPGGVKRRPDPPRQGGSAATAAPA